MSQQLETIINNAWEQRAQLSPGAAPIEVLDAVDRVAGLTLERHIEPRRMGDPDALVADNSQILARLPWQPRYADLDLIVKHALAWERQLHTRSNSII